SLGAFPIGPAICLGSPPATEPMKTLPSFEYANVRPSRDHCIVRPFVDLRIVRAAPPAAGMVTTWFSMPKLASESVFFVMSSEYVNADPSSSRRYELMRACGTMSRDRPAATSYATTDRTNSERRKSSHARIGSVDAWIRTDEAPVSSSKRLRVSVRQ